ncbi:MAG: hypothetical protein M3Z25_14880 [Actinomycetota bacterium]|nr:hypothetical protein [Actinomycetota bacterium]
MSLDWTEALRRECDEMTRFCRELSDGSGALPASSWATRRSPWREHDVTIDGDEEYGARFLDAMNVV